MTSSLPVQIEARLSPPKVVQDTNKASEKSGFPQKAQGGQRQETEIKTQDKRKTRQEEINRNLEKGRQALKQGDYQSAKTAFSAVLSLEPGHKEASNLLREAQTEASRRILEDDRRKAQERSHEIDLLMGEGREAFAAGRTQDARAAFQAVLNKEPGNKEASDWLKRVQEHEEWRRKAGINVDKDRLPKFGYNIPVNKPPTLIEQPKPVYPERARRAGVGGVVYIQILVDETGKVRDVKIIRGPEIFYEAAKEAA